MLAIYCRISQEKEEGKDRSLDFQKKIGIELAEELGLKYRVYIDDGISGTWEIDKRPAFAEMLTDIVKKGSKITALYGYDRFRLSRNDEVRIQMLSICRKHNVKIFHEKIEYKWNDPTAKLLDTVLSAMGEFYVDITKKHVRGVLKQRALKGKVHGVMPYGYKRDENEKMIPDTAEAKIVKQIYKWSLDGLGYKAISYKLNDMGVPTRYHSYKGTYTVDKNRNNQIKQKEFVTRDKKDVQWNGGSIKRILTNDTYTGIRRFGDYEFEIPAIIDKTTFNSVGNYIKERGKKSGKRNFYKYLLNNLVFCSKCGNRYTGREVNAHFYYRCTSRISKGASCKNKGIRMKELDTLIWARFFKSKVLTELVEKHLKENGNKDKIDVLQTKITALEKGNSKLTKERGNAISLTVKGILSDSDIKAELLRIDKEIKDNTTIISNLSEQLQSYLNSKHRLKQIGADLRQIKKNTSFNDKQKLIQKYIKTINVIYKDGWFILDIEFNISGMPIERYELDKDYKVAVQVDDSGKRIVIHLKTGEVTYHPRTNVSFWEI